jgi:hypothetical protein
MRAIFVVDPGESTGVAWGILDDRAHGAGRSEEPH